MRKIKTINFLKEDKIKDNYFISFLLILVLLLFFQEISYLKSIKTLECEINQMKALRLENENKNKNVKLEKSTILEDTKDIYSILGPSNVQSLKLSNNKIEIEGICEDLRDIDKLKSMRNIKNFSIDTVEKKENNYLFKAVYEIGGVN